MRPEGGTLAALSKELKLPKTSLHRLLRTLEHGGYLENLSSGFGFGERLFAFLGINLLRRNSSH